METTIQNNGAPDPKDANGSLGAKHAKIPKDYATVEEIKTALNRTVSVAESASPREENDHTRKQVHR